MRKQWKGFVAGLLAAMLLGVVAAPALAALTAKTIQVHTGVNVYVDGVKVDPKDVNGNPVDVFVYNGTTYLPIRAIGNALGKSVRWDGSTNTAYVGEQSQSRSSVYLKDLDYFEGNGWSIYDAKDNLGVEHKDVLTGHNRSNTYLINGQYSAISGTFFLHYNDRSNYDDSTLDIYGDGRLLYSATMHAGIQPIDFYVDLTGVTELQVDLHSLIVNTTAIADCTLVP